MIIPLLSLKNKLICISILLFTLIINSCNKEDLEKLDLRIENVVIKNVGEFEFKDSLVFMANDLYQYQLKFETDLEDVNLYYSKNDEGFVHNKNVWIDIDSGFNHLNFYFEKKGFKRTGLKKLDFQTDNDSLLKNTTIYPYPFEREFYININEFNVRGQIEFTFYDISGRLVDRKIEFKSEDIFETQVDFLFNPPGMYVVKLRLGNQIKTMKVLKK